MLCRSVAIQGLENINKAIAGAEMAEIRIEKSGLTVHEVRKLFASHPNLLATCRPEGISQQMRKELLSAAIEGGAKWIDLEIESDVDFCASLIDLAKEKGCQVIISYHNYDFTPDAFRLNEIVEEAQRLHADVVKIATQVNTLADNARLLNLYSQNITLLAIGMGTLGKITRIAATKMGAPFTFVSVDTENSTAPGQLHEEQMRNILDSF